MTTTALDDLGVKIKSDSDFDKKPAEESKPEKPKDFKQRAEEMEKEHLKEIKL